MMRTKKELLLSLFLLCFFFGFALAGCSTVVLSERDQELKRGECVSCLGTQGEKGFCCKYPINEEKLCLF